MTEEDRATAIDNMHKNFVKFALWFLTYARGQTERQTHRHADRNTPLSQTGRRNNQEPDFYRQSSLLARYKCMLWPCVCVPVVASRCSVENDKRIELVAASVVAKTVIQISRPRSRPL